MVAWVSAEFLLNLTPASRDHLACSHFARGAVHWSKIAGAGANPIGAYLVYQPLEVSTWLSCVPAPSPITLRLTLTLTLTLPGSPSARWASPRVRARARVCVHVYVLACASARRCG